MVRTLGGIAIGFPFGILLSRPSANRQGGPSWRRGPDFPVLATRLQRHESMKEAIPIEENCTLSGCGDVPRTEWEVLGELTLIVMVFTKITPDKQSPVEISRL